MIDTIYVGTYTKSKPGEEHRKEGIYIYQMDTESGRLERGRGVVSGPNPSFLAMHPSGKFLFSVNETMDSLASAFAIDPSGAGLVLINREATQGMHACYASIDPGGRWLMVSNYSSGSLAVFPINQDGRLSPLSDFIHHKGQGPNKQRQEAAHAHSIRFDPSGRFALAADLGIDRVLVYRLDPANGKLALNDPAGMDARPGAGPRHMEFDRSGRFLYVANELDSTVTTCAWNALTGTIKPLASYPTVPAAFDGENTVADIHRTPSGEYLYVSNRGHNSIAGYRVDAESGLLTSLGIFPCGGDWPRNFAIDPAGKYLLVANQYSNNLVVFQIEASGVLTPTGIESEVPAPVCVLFA
jgi:6-phosphogluconolactonase